MKFLVDAQLPGRLAAWLRARGHDVTHTRDLALGNKTPDRLITQVADAEERAVITKDADFLLSHTLVGAPRRLVLISTGNIDNDGLLTLMDQRLDAVVDALQTPCCVEIATDAMVVHSG